MEVPYVTFYLMAVVMITLSVTICEILVVEMYMTSTLTFRLGRGHIWIHVNQKTACGYLCVDNCTVCPIHHRLRNSHVRTCRYIRFECLTLKIKAKDVDDCDENLQRRTHCTDGVRAQKLALLGRSRLFAVRNRTFRGGRTALWHCKNVQMLITYHLAYFEKQRTKLKSVLMHDVSNRQRSVAFSWQQYGILCNLSLEPASSPGLFATRLLQMIKLNVN